MTFDAVLFNGDNPFELDHCHSIIRLNGLSLEEVKAISCAANRSGVGMFLYPNITPDE